MSARTRLVTIGNELLNGEIQDENSPYLAARAFRAGFPVSTIEIVPDDREAIAGAVRRAAADLDASRVVVSGGVGPTHDDVTLEGVALGLGLELVLHPTVYSRIETTTIRLHEAGRLPSGEVTEAHRRMAMAGAGAIALENPRGMASPFAHDLGDQRWLFVLPGVPREFRTVVDDVLLPNYFSGGSPLHSAEILFSGVPESTLAATLRQVESEYPGVALGSYPHVETRELTIRARGTDPEKLAAALARVRQLGPQ